MVEEWYLFIIMSNGVLFGFLRMLFKVWYEFVIRSGSYSFGDVVDAWLFSVIVGGVVI